MHSAYERCAVPARFTKPFDATTAGDKVRDGVDLSRRHGVVTDRASAIGNKTDRVLACARAEVFIAVSNSDAGASAVDDIKACSTDLAQRRFLAAVGLLEEARS
jgi:hypothetical protein